EDDDACGIVFKVRDGKLIGKQHFFFTNIEGKSDSEILSALIEQYYSVDEEAGAMKPPTIVHPKIGEKAKLMEMVRTNARFLLGEIKLQKMKESDHIPHVLKAL